MEENQGKKENYEKNKKMRRKCKNIEYLKKKKMKDQKNVEIYYI